MGFLFSLGEGKRREGTRGGAPEGKNYPADTTETLWLQNFYFSSGMNNRARGAVLLRRRAER